MTRSMFLKSPLGAAALGGLLLFGPVSMAGLAQDKPQAGEGAVIADDGGNGFSDNQPFPWPTFLGIHPEPGRYRSRLKVVDVAMPDVPEMESVDMEGILRQSMDSEQTYCIRGDEPLEDWARELGDGECAEPQVNVDGDRFTMHAVCSDGDGMHMELDASGEVATTSAVSTIRVTGSEQDVGRIIITFQTRTRRIGDCN